MYNLNAEFDKCKSMLDAIEVPYNKGVSVSINTRAHSRFGQARKRQGVYSININVDLLDERNPIDMLHDTIIHELLHTCPDCMNHGEKWKQWALKVNRKYGMDIKRCTSVKDAGLQVFTGIKANWIVKCDKCGREYVYQRAGKVVQNPEKYRCHCGGKLTAKHG